MLSEWAGAVAALPPVVGLLLKFTALLALAWGLKPFVGRANVRWQVFYWRGVVLAAALMPLVVLFGPTVPVPVLEGAVAEPLVVSELSSVEPWLPATANEVSVDVALAAVAFEAVPVVESQPVESHAMVWQWSEILAAAWLLPVLTLIAGALLRDRRTLRLVRNAEPAPAGTAELLARVASDLGYVRPIRVCVSPEIHSPRVTGMFRPTILLPKTLEVACESDLRGIFAHELSHLISHDLIWARLFQVLSIGFWFHPLAWGLGRQHLEACEQVSDRAAAEYVGDADAYASMLARVALRVMGGQTLAGIAMARTPQIKQRLAGLGMSAPPLRRRQTVPMVGLGMVLAVSLGGLQLVETRGTAAEPVAAEAGTHDAAESAEGVEAKTPWKTISARGRVVDSDGEAVAGATVYLREWSFYRYQENLGAKQFEDVLARATTDGDGRFEFRDVPARLLGKRWNLNAPWDVVCRKEGYGMAWLHLSDAQSSVPLLLRIAPESPITGRVLDQSGSPVAGAEVKVSTIGALREKVFASRSAATLDLAYSEIAGHATTDPEGKVVLRGLPADRRLWLLVSHDEFSQGVVHVATTDSPQPSIIVPGSMQAGLGMSTMPVSSGEFSLEMKPAGPTMRGRVTCADSGKPCAGARLELRSDKRYRYTVTDENGEYVIRDAFPSSSRLSISPAVESQCLSQSVEFDLEGVASEKNVDVVVRRGHLVMGTITVEETGEGVPGVRVQSRSRDLDAALNVPPAESKTDHSGRFRVVVPEGTSRIRIYGPVDGCLVPKFSTRTVSFDPRHYRDIEVIAGQPIEPVHFVVERGKVVDGVVSDSEGKPIPGATVRVYRRNNRTRHLKQTSTTDQVGRFEVSGLETLEHLELLVSHRDSGRAGFVKLEAEYSDEKVSADVTLEPAACFTGVVLLDGKPQSGVRVALSNSRFIPQTSVTDDEGRYRFELIVPGKNYGVTVSSEYHSDDKITSVQARPGETREVAVLNVVSYTASVSGIVVDPQGNPVEGARISASFDGGFRGLRLPTGKDGRFVLDRLPSEPLTLIATLRPGSDLVRPTGAMATVRVSPNQDGLRIMIDPKLAKVR